MPVALAVFSAAASAAASAAVRDNFQKSPGYEWTTPKGFRVEAAGTAAEGAIHTAPDTSSSCVDF